MSSTPIRKGKSIKSLNTSFSPIRFNSSPTLNKSRKSDVVTISQRVLSIVKRLVENHENWMTAQKRGQAVCRSIENMKCKALDEATKNTTLSVFPAEMQALCDRFDVIISVFSDIINNTKESSRQMIALEKLNPNKIDPVFKTWTMEKIIEFLDTILMAYEEEYRIKLKIAENIAHSKNQAEAVFHSTVWDYPFYVNSDIAFKFNLLSLECLS